MIIFGFDQLNLFFGEINLMLWVSTLFQNAHREAKLSSLAPKQFSKHSH